MLSVGSVNCAVQSLCDSLMNIVERLRENRFFDISLLLLDKVKENLQTIHDYKTMLVPLEKEKQIYENMHSIKITRYASYFMVEFLGAGHH